MADNKRELSGEYLGHRLGVEAGVIFTALRHCIEKPAGLSSQDRELMVGFTCYVLSRPLELAGCDAEDRRRLMDCVLRSVLRLEKTLRFEDVHPLMRITHDLLSGRDVENTHIRTSLISFLDAMEKGGCSATSDDSELYALVQAVEAAQVQVQSFVREVQRRTWLNWEPGALQRTQGNAALVKGVADLWNMVQNEYENLRG
jgi:hypothetical protein